jgi:transcriptional regulator GlxA family with amidase domain
VLDAAGRVTGGTPYRVRLATFGGQDVGTGSGLVMRADLALEDVTDPVDLLLVPGRLPRPGETGDQELAGLVREVVRLAPRSRQVASVCTGAEVLAEAGLLDGRRATTHWAFGRSFRRRFPEVSWELDRLVVRDGAVATSAGVGSGLDLALSLVEDELGTAAAREVARWLVIFLRRPGGQAQFRGRFIVPPTDDRVVLSVVQDVLARPAADHRIDVMADRASLSSRHLTRRFLHEVGTTPARFVDRVRVEAARDALETGTTVAAAARTSGFSSAELMRRAFLRTLGVGPADYQDRFRTAHAVIHERKDHP